MNYNDNQYQRSAQKDAPRRRPEDKSPSALLLSSLPFVVALPIALIYLEIIAHLATFSDMDSAFFAYITLFSMASGMIMALLCTIFNKKVNYIISLILIGAATLLCAIQVVYSAFFGNFFQLTTLGMAGNIVDYMDNTVKVIFANLHWILLLFLPFVLFAVFGRKVVVPVKMNWMLRACCAVFAVCFFMLGTLYVNAHDDDFGDSFIYGEGFLVNDSIGRFGVLTTARLEIQYHLFGKETFSEPEDTIVINNDTTAIRGEDIFGPKDPVTTTPGNVTPPPASGTEGEGTSQNPGTSGSTDVTGSSGTVTDEKTDPPAPPVIDRSPQRLDIDFEALKADALAKGKTKLYNAHTFFESRPGTNKHEYTGLFKGKNLIYITVEGWAPSAINEKLTPTLYMMKNSGFVFDNYYCSLWGGSTATGEYANITGNFYYSASCIKNSASTYQPFALGNMLSAQGYATHAFHNHTYTYYSRNLSHPNFGYDWHAVGNWDATYTKPKAWPQSDYELGLNSLPFLNSDKPFHLYYMTVSGHAYQTFGGNTQAAKHRSYVTSIIGNDYKTETALSFISCQYEVELMVKALYDECERLGILEDTVFVLAPDHFPYGLTESNEKNCEALADMYGLPAENIYNNYKLYEAPLIIWSGSMKEPVKVDKVCSAIDILPTLLNLFGLEYDSRIIMGQDILDAGAEGIVPLNFEKTSYHFLTDYGFFNFTTKKFEVFEQYSGVDQNALAAYVSQKRDYLYYMRIYSPYILDSDYYRILFPNG
ncbi:MAG: LTA synthase family protein [Clostridia bacterium]|nr:LTA synthase family protein [Clostridia bacterium]